MKFILRALPLALLMTTSLAYASSVNLGDAVYHITGEVYPDYTIKQITAYTRVYATDDNSKVLGQWKDCFDRSLNVPYQPLAKYNYRGFEVGADSAAYVKVSGNRTIEVDEAAILKQFKDLNVELQKQTKGKCKIKTQTHVELAFQPAGVDSTVRSFFFLSKEGQKVTVNFSNWKRDMSGLNEYNEFLPNQTEIELGFPY